MLKNIDLSHLGLHYTIWRLIHTGGGCMVAVSDNIEVGNKTYFIGVTSDCVVIYEDDFKSVFMTTGLTEWGFGDNPTVLMNQLEEFGLTYQGYDGGKLFDDIVTIAKVADV